MKLALAATRGNVIFGLWGTGPDPNIAVAKLAESLGYDSIWTAEACGTDAVVPLAWLAAHTDRIKVGTAIMQISARPPTTTAMAAATLDLMSGGRFILGLGVSGPAVVEGWHGTAYGKPLKKTREYVKVVRDVLSRHPVNHSGLYYQIPYRDDGATGLADPARLMFRPKRSRIPIYLASIGPKNVALAFEIADGVIPAFYSPYREKEFFSGLPEGSERRIDIAPFVPIALGDDIDRCRRRLKPGLAFWLGAMGAKGLNFYNNLACRLGFEGSARDIQRLYMGGRSAEAAAAVPDELVDEVALFGPREHIAEQLEAWRKSSVTTLILQGATPDAIAVMAELVL